jgi:hypothetical protein
MEKLEHPLWVVEWVNALLGPLVAAALKPLGYDFHGGEVIPNYLVMVMLIVAAITVMCLIMRSRLSVEHPSKFQIVLADAVHGTERRTVEWIGPEGKRFSADLHVRDFHPAEQLRGPGARSHGADEQHQRAARVRDHARGSTTTCKGLKKQGVVRYPEALCAAAGRPDPDGAADARSSRRSAMRRVCSRSRFDCSATSLARR